MSEIKGAFYSVTMQIRPQTVVTISNSEQEALIGEPDLTIVGMQDFVFYEDAQAIGEIWRKSLTEKTKTPFRENMSGASPEEKVLQAAALAADKIDIALLGNRIENMDYPIPSSFSIQLPPTDIVERAEALETLVPFSRIKELLQQRERITSGEQMGWLDFSAVRLHTPNAVMH